MAASNGDHGRAQADGGGAEARAAKRAQFAATPRRSFTPYVLVAVAAIAAATVGVVLLAGGDDGPAAQEPAQTAAVEGGVATVSLAELEGGTAKFYSAQAGGTTVKYFLVLSADGSLRAAFDACDVCYPARKGYTQDGDVMVCDNCGRGFPIEGIGAAAGGCNPSPLEAEVRDGEVVIGADALAAGARYFQ